LPIGEIIKVQGERYSRGYKDDLFMLWYNNGKPTGQRLWEMIPEEWEIDKPRVNAITVWIRDIYKPRAEMMDERLAQELEGRLVKEKVEMLYRHANVGKLMQNKALACLDSIEPSELSTSAAVRLLVEGVRIERESIGLPQALEKMLNETDEDLLNRVEKLLGESPAEILEE